MFQRFSSYFFSLSPSVQKTIKQRVEAIEKLQSPAPQNTRGRQMNEADVSINLHLILIE